MDHCANLGPSFTDTEWESDDGSQPRRETRPAAARRGREPPRHRELNPEQTLLLEAIASVADGVGLYDDEHGEERYARVAHTIPAGAERDAFSEAMRALAREIAQAAVDGTGAAAEVAPGPAVVRDVVTPAGRHRMLAFQLRPGFFGAEASVLVIADRVRDAASDPHYVRERFGLTPREVDVALLLAERRSNAEIARALGISAHTARHHTERVLFKLGAKKRHDVARILRTSTVARER